MSRASSHSERVETTAADFIPTTRSLRSLAEAAEACRGCDLYRHATQVVFGSGRKSSRIVLIGEQPGDREDQAGEPFVGPAGEMLEECLTLSAIARDDVYVTNAVKHFKFEERGKRRLHQKPSARELKACRPWLRRELELIRPAVLICLGASAAQTILGSKVRVTKDHGRRMRSDWCPNTMVTFHPSAVLRAPTGGRREELKETLIADFRVAARWLHSQP